ncbi:MAG: lipo-like protein [Paraburkholderia sp.]|nr:MAG: lipo-like protein [Paraburkholderia sp.]
MDFFCSAIGRRLARYLSAPVKVNGIAPATRPEILLAHLKPGDVLLVEGHSRISSAIRYLTQSTWSHAALYVDNYAPKRMHAFVEADIVEGVRVAGIDEYAGLNTRICRPVGISERDIGRVCEFAVARIGQQYDLRNIIDLARYLLPTPPVPQRFRRHMLSLGSGSPTRAICSTLIALAFQSIGYPILPSVYQEDAGIPGCDASFNEILRVRHHSLFVPRDFDISPYFAIVKPAVEERFDYTRLLWEKNRADLTAPGYPTGRAPYCRGPQGPFHDLAGMQGGDQGAGHVAMV